MKVVDVEIGMMLQPAGDQEIFLKVGPQLGGKEMGYITVRTANHNFFQGEHTKTRMAMYLGRRSDVGVTKDEMGWSDRYVLFNNEVVAVDPSSWGRMTPL
jgi:hypothetical protein